MATTFTPTPTFSGLALAALFHGSASLTDAVQADISYILTGPNKPGLLYASSPASMTVHCNPFTCLLAGSSPASAGPQLWSSGTSPLDFTLNPADLNNPRYDMITVQVIQQPDATTTPPTPGLAAPVIVSGTPAVSPIEPPVPAGSLILGRVLVAAGASVTISSAGITPRQALGGLRGAVVRGYSGAASRVTRPGQGYYYDPTSRLYIAQQDDSLNSVPGIGAMPNWYLKGVPVGFTVPNITDKILGYASAIKNVGISLANQTTAAVVTATESGEYWASTGWRLGTNGNGVGERVVAIEHRDSSGIRINRAQIGLSNQAVPTMGHVSDRFFMNVGDQLMSICFHSAGAGISMGFNDSFSDYIFQGYKLRDL